MTKSTSAALAVFGLLALLGAWSAPADRAAAGPADGIVRHPLPGDRLPISRSVAVPAGAEHLYVSGHVPPRLDNQAAVDTPAAYGDTETQARGVLKRIEGTLDNAGWGMDDIVLLRVYLVADPPATGTMDFAGLMRAYNEFFGTEVNPNKPARAVVEIKRLANPGWLVEIEAIAARLPDSP